jgi:uncharacterized Zn finger protein (UPF0148 family)
MEVVRRYPAPVTPRCPDCGAVLVWFEGAPYCPDCCSFEPTAEADEAEPQHEGDDR